MKHILLLALATIFTAVTHAQITITQADYGQAGDSLIVGYDDFPPSGLSVGGTGSQTWDFTSLSLSNINSLNFVDPVNTISGGAFPNADLAIERQNDTLFFASSSAAFVIDGFAGSGFGFPINIIADFNPNSTQIEFPSTLNASFVDTAVFDTTVNCAEFGFGSTCDSARLKRVLIGTSTVDAYGEVSTPGGTFTTVRQYFVEDNKDTVWIKVPFFGWQQFIDSASTEHNYRWIANGEKWPVLSARADGAGGDIVTAEYVVGAQVLGYVSAENDPSCSNGCNGSATVSAVGGIPPYSYAWPGGQTTAAVNGLCAGNYLVTITDNDTGSYVVSVELNDPAPISIVGAVQGVNLGADGAIDITVSGGTNPYSYVWSGPNGFTATTQDIGSLEIGNYSVTVTDNNNCDSSATFVVDLTGIHGPVDGGFKAYPNPADEQVQLVSSNRIQAYRLTDLLGNVLISNAANDNAITLMTSGLAAGIYMVEVETVLGTYFRKITVKH
ncbi:MAG: T9SS type A sorting domain-containing protein [Cryomorphaceae bacterium]